MEARSNTPRATRRRRPTRPRSRRWLTTAVLVLALLALAAALAMQHVDELLRAHVERRLTAQLNGLSVTVQAARRLPGKGIELRGISISDPRLPEAARQLVYLDEMLAVCSTDLRDLVSGPPRIRRLVLRRPRIRAAHGAESGWNLQRLLPLPNLGGGQPSAVIENATVEIVDLENSGAAPLTIRDLNLTITPARRRRQPPGPRSPRVAHSSPGAQSPPNAVSPHGARGLPSADGSFDSDGTPAPDGLSDPAAYRDPDAPAVPSPPPVSSTPVVPSALAGREAGSSENVLLVEGELVSEHFQRVTLRGQVDPVAGTWSASGRIHELELSSRLLSKLPGEAARTLAPLASLRARADLEFQFANPTTSGGAPRFVVSGQLAEGRFDDQRLPYPLIDLRADVYCDPQGIKIDNLRARTGRTTLELSFHSQGYGKTSPFVLNGRARNLLLDQRLYETLPEDLRRIWDDYAVGGVLNVDMGLRYDGQNYEPDVVVECLNVSFAVCDFPYPMNHGQGTLRFRGRTLSTSDFRARAGSQWLHVKAEVLRPGPGWSGWIEARADGPVPIDRTLLAAVDENAASVIRSLQPTGMLTLVHGRYDRPDPQGDAHQELELELENVAIQFKGFPYPIHSIQGKLQARDGHWTFRDLVGRNDTAYIVCDGNWQPYADRGGRLELEFDCRAVPLEDELRLALDPGGQEVWANLRPRGTIDQLGISLLHDSRREGLELDVRAQQWPPRTNVAGRSLSLFPAHFPYRLDNLTGAVRYRNGVVEIHSVRAIHGRTQVQLAGRFQQPPGAPWELRFDQLIADGLVADHDLLAALPSGFGQHLARMQLKGIMNLRGGAARTELPGTAWTGPPGPSEMGGPSGTSLERRIPFEPTAVAERFLGDRPAAGSTPTPVALVLRGGGPDSLPLEAEWKLALDVENGHLSCGVDLDHVRGGVQLEGRLDASGFHSRGELAIDSLLLKGMHVTRLRGPLWIEPTRVVFGSPAVARPGEPPPRSITGTIFDGRISLVGQAGLQADAPFELTLSLTDADLAKIARETFPRQRRISGQAVAQLNLRGVADRSHTFQGGGFIRLNNADIYELPVMVALLKLLSVRRPNTTAFTSSNIDFRVQGEDVYFEPIDFRGDAISLIGKGWMDLDQNIRLTFYTQVGRREFPLLGSVLAEASRNILEIQVVGTLNDPLVQQTAFPELDETLQRLFPEARRRAATLPGWFGTGTQR